MVAAALGIPDALNDRGPALLVQLRHGCEFRVEAQRRIDFMQFAFRQPQGRAVAAIMVVRVGHDGVQAVVPAGQLQDDQDVVAAVGRRAAANAARDRMGGTSGARASKAGVPTVDFSQSRRVRDMIIVLRVVKVYW